MVIFHSYVSLPEGIRSVVIVIEVVNNILSARVS